MHEMRRLTRRQALGGAAATVAAGAFAVTLADANPDPQALLVMYVGGERKWNGLGPVVGNPGLQAQAELQATRMMEVGHLFHTPNAEFGWWLAPGRLGWIGEIVGVAGGTSEREMFAVHQAWVRSAPHLAIMLEPQARLIGCGVRRLGGAAWAAIVMGN